MYEIRFAVDKELKVINWDKGSEKIMGNMSVESLGRHYFLILPRLLSENVDAIETVIQNGRFLRLENYRVNCFCGVADADVSIDPVINNNSEINGASVHLKIHPVCILSKKLDESKMLIDMGTASAGLAHGLRSPLNAIKGAIVYLEGKYHRDDDFLEFSKIIEDEIGKLDRFITKFLSRSLKQPEPKIINIELLLDKIMTMVNMQAHQKKITFVRNKGDIPQVKVNYLQTEHAILNIISNSIEAMEHAGIIAISTYKSDHDEKEYVTIEISDSGYGFNEPEKSHALREESVRKGRGFGLFLTREIIYNMGGFLEIASTRMVGTTVKINIPTVYQ